MVKLARFLAALLISAVPASAQLFKGPPTMAGGTQNVLTVSLTNENVTAGAAVGTLIGHVTATTDNGAFTGTFSIDRTNASDGPSCGAATITKLVSTGTGTADLQVNQAGLNPQNYGKPPSPFGFPGCIKATPTSGNALIREFTMMVRGATFTSLMPQTVACSPCTAGATLATLGVTIANGPAPSPTWSLGSDALCADLTLTGSTLKVGASTITTWQDCHISATQSGVTPSPYTADVWIGPAPYVGPGDIMSWNARADLYCYSAAYASPGTNPAFTLKRETDLATQVINCLPTGDADLATAATFCANSYCYGQRWNDQSGNAGGDYLTWAAYNGNPLAPTVHQPGYQVNCVLSMPCWTNSNGTDDFWQLHGYSASASATGTMTVVAMENSNAFGGRLLSMNSTNGVSPDIADIGFFNGTGAGLYVGSINGGGTTISAAALPSIMHSFIGAINTSSSDFMVDGVVNSGTLGTANLTAPLWGPAGDWGGGGLQGWTASAGVSATVASSGQQIALCGLDQRHWGTCPSTGPPPTPVITFNLPPASYIYPAAPATLLANAIASVSSGGSFIGGGGTFTSANCPAVSISVAAGGNITAAQPNNLVGSVSCTVSANYPGAVSVSQTFTLTGTQQTIASIGPSPPCSLTGTPASPGPPSSPGIPAGCNYSFTPPASSLTLGALPTVTMSGGIPFAAGGGTIGLGTGSQCSNYVLSGSNLQITASSAGTYGCSYVLTDPAAAGSPVTTPITAVGSTIIQTFASVPFSPQLLAPGAPSGTVVGVIGTPVMSPPSPAFSGSCCTLSGPNAANFQIVGSNLETNGAICPTPPATFNINLVPTQSGIAAFAQPVTITCNAPSANTLTVAGAAAQSQTNYPYQFGRPFLDGAIPHYPQVLINGSPAAYSQSDVKNRYPDGSVEYAVISTIIPQISPTDCSVTADTPLDGVPYGLWATHGNSPVFAKAANPTTNPLYQNLNNANCNHFNGNVPRTAFAVLESSPHATPSVPGGGFGFTELPPFPAPTFTGAIFSLGMWAPSSTYPQSLFGVDFEGGGATGTGVYVPLNTDVFGAVTYDGAQACVYALGYAPTPPGTVCGPTIASPSNTQGNYAWGPDGDHVPAFEGGMAGFDNIFVQGVLSTTVINAVSNAQSAYYAHPGSASPVECSIAGVTCDLALSVTHRMVAGATKAFRLYNISTTISQDIGFDSNGNADTASALAFCGTVANCLYITVYDQVAEGRLGPVTISFQDTTTPNNAAISKAAMEALLPVGATTLTLTPNTGTATGTADAGTMLANGSYSLWTSGPVAQTIELADDTATRQYDIGFGDGYHPFRPRYYATFWPALSKVFIRLVGEVGASTEQEDLKYHLAVADGYTADLSGTQATNPKFHWVNSRWTHTFWLGGAAPIQSVNIDPNLPYLTSTRFLPNLDTTITIPPRQIATAYSGAGVGNQASGNWLAAPHDIYDGYWDAGSNTGFWNWQNAMGSPGNSYHIGPYPLSTMFWLHSPDWRLRAIALNMADLAAAWPIDIRETDTTRIFQRGDTPGSGTGLGRVISAAGRPQLGAYTGNPDNLINVGTITAGPWTADDAHQPSVYFPAYIETGDPWYLDMMYAWGGWTVFEDAGSTYYDCTNQTGNCSIFRGPSGAYGGMYGSKAPRAVAWTLRGRAETAFAAPDGVPEKNYFRYMTNDAIAKWEGGAGITGTAFDTATVKSWVKLTNFPYAWGSWGGPTPGLAGQYPPLGNMDSGFCTPPSTLVTCGVPLTTQQSEYGLVPGANGTIDNPWMNYYLDYGVGRAAELGFAMGPVQAIVDTFPIGIINTSGKPWFLGSYGLGVEQQGGGYWTSWAQYFASGGDPTYIANLQTNFAGSLGAGGYVTLVAPGLAEAVDDSVSGAAAAWAWYNTNVYSILGANGTNAADPRWAIVPRTDHNVLPAQSTATPP